MDGLRKLAATWFYSGYAPVASGTFGTLAAIPFYVATVLVLQAAVGLGVSGWVIYACFTVALTLFAFWAAGCGEQFWGKGDAGQIVIDEVAGFYVTMFLVPLSWEWVVAGFFVFRFFDIVKIWPANYFDSKVGGGLGVTMDDIFAGLYSCIVLHVLHAIACHWDLTILAGFCHAQ